MTIHCTNHNNETVEMVFKPARSNKFEKHYQCPKCWSEIILELEEPEVKEESNG